MRGPDLLEAPLRYSARSQRHPRSLFPPPPLPDTSLRPLQSTASKEEISKQEAQQTKPGYNLNGNALRWLLLHTHARRPTREALT